MNHEEIEYAEMLEIPVSTVSVIKKHRKGPKKENLQQSLIGKINGRLDAQDEQADLQEADPTATISSPETTEEQANNRDFETLLVEDPPRAPLSWREKRNALWRSIRTKDDSQAQPSRAARIVYRVEFAAACALCLGIFLTNVFMPGSAINTFFRSLSAPAEEADARVFSDFTLGGVVGEYSTATVAVSPEGVISFTAEGCVYCPVDGEVTDVLVMDGGRYAMKVAHNDSFTSVIEGVSTVYYQVGDEVKHNVPVAFSDGSAEVQVTMYSDGELLNCVQITDENCLAWAQVSE